MANIINSLTFGSGTYVITLPYATCSTAAGTAAKVATITPGSNFSLETGARVSVKFDAANSASAPTLNVNQSGAKTIRFRGAALTSSLFYWAAGSVVDFVYDGTYWNMTGSPHNYDSNTTYTFNGAVSTIKDSNLTASRALVSNSNGKVAVSEVTSTELGYLDGVTSNIQTQLDNKSDYRTSFSCSCSDGTGGYIKICKIPMTTAYNDKTLELTLVSRSCNYEKIIVQLQTSTPATCVNTKILVSGNDGDYYQVHGYKYNTGTAGSEYIEIWCTLPAWDTVKIFRSYFYSNNSDVITWYGERATTLPTTSTTTVKFSAELEKWSGSAANVAWSGVTSKPSYYDAKAITSISRSGTTFTATYLDGTTATFSQQDNNTYGRTANTTSKIYLMGGTTQSDSNKTTYSNVNCYASGGYLYSGGTKVSVEGHTHALAESGVTAGSYGPAAGEELFHSQNFYVPQLSVDKYGRVTSIATATYTLPSSDSTDTKVTNTLGTTTKFYLTGTTATSTTTGTQYFDTGIYSDTTAGKLCATTFATTGITMGITEANDNFRILPYSNNYSYIGESGKQFWRVYAKAIYEDGTALSSKYASASHTHTNLTMTWNTF